MFCKKNFIKTGILENICWNLDCNLESSLLIQLAGLYYFVCKKFVLIDILVCRIETSHYSLQSAPSAKHIVTIKQKTEMSIKRITNFELFISSWFNNFWRKYCKAQAFHKWYFFALFDTLVPALIFSDFVLTY